MKVTREATRSLILYSRNSPRLGPTVMVPIVVQGTVEMLGTILRKQWPKSVSIFIEGA